MSRPDHVGRYRLYRYSRLHFAVDCEDDNIKIANIYPDTNARELLDKIDGHETVWHLPVTPEGQNP